MCPLVLRVHAGVTALRLCSLTYEGCFCCHVKVAVAFESGASEKTTHGLFTTRTFFADEVKQLRLGLLL